MGFEDGCLRVGGSEHEQASESPHLEIECILKVGTEFEGLWNGIISVVLNTSDNESGFTLIEESPRLRGMLREVDNEEVSGNSEHACNDTFNLCI
jgi:hypothetical protein